PPAQLGASCLPRIRKSSSLRPLSCPADGQPVQPLPRFAFLLCRFGKALHASALPSVLDTFHLLLKPDQYFSWNNSTVDTAAWRTLSRGHSARQQSRFCRNLLQLGPSFRFHLHHGFVFIDSATTEIYTQVLGVHQVLG